MLISPDVSNTCLFVPAPYYKLNKGFFLGFLFKPLGGILYLLLTFCNLLGSFTLILPIADFYKWCITINMQFITYRHCHLLFSVERSFIFLLLIILT